VCPPKVYALEALPSVWNTKRWWRLQEVEAKASCLGHWNTVWEEINIARLGP
jgi:hypothetical protein